MNIDLVKLLVEAYGPSGFEDNMRDLIRPLAQIGLLRSMLTGSVLFLMGLTLDARSIGRAVRRPTRCQAGSPR